MAPSVLFYYANFRGVTNLGFFGHMWSLSLEEQFYIVWPAFMILVLRFTNSYRWLFGTAFCLGIASTAWRFVLSNDAPIGRIGRLFDVRAAGILFGCAAAVALARASDEQRQRARLPLAGAATIGGAVLIALVVAKFDPRPSLRLPLVLVDFSALALILHVVVSASSRIATFLSHRRLVAMGRISYGLYLWHVPAFMVVWSTTRGSPRIVTILIDFAVAFALAIASFRFVEEPALKLKARLARNVQLDVSAPE
jgi:peptidoglycan/LPS O-acetylase OafA/YrhL